jgi:hypothetical protein
MSSQDAHQVRLAGHQVPHSRIHASGTYLDQHLVRTDGGPADVTQLDHAWDTWRSSHRRGFPTRPGLDQPARCSVGVQEADLIAGILADRPVPRRLGRHQRLADVLP